MFHIQSTFPPSILDALCSTLSWVGVTLPSPPLSILGESSSFLIPVPVAHLHPQRRYLGSHVHTCTSIPLTATDFPRQIGSLNWANQSPFPDPAYHSWWKCTWTPIPKWVSLSWGNLELGQKRKQSLSRCLAYNLNILALSTAKLSILCGEETRKSERENTTNQVSSFET